MLWVRVLCSRDVLFFVDCLLIIIIIIWIYKLSKRPVWILLYRRPILIAPLHLTCSQSYPDQSASYYGWIFWTWISLSSRRLVRCFEQNKRASSYDFVQNDGFLLWKSVQMAFNKLAIYTFLQRNAINPKNRSMKKSYASRILLLLHNISNYVGVVFMRLCSSVFDSFRRAFNRLFVHNRSNLGSYCFWRKKSI